jgi:transcriptional regulator with XRE-family HTH domain
MRMTTGEKIRYARKKRGIKQNELARRIGARPQQLLQWEKGIRNPKLDVITKISFALNVELGYFDDWDEDTNPDIFFDSQEHIELRISSRENTLKSLNNFLSLMDNNELSQMLNEAFVIVSQRNRNK